MQLMGAAGSTTPVIHRNDVIVRSNSVVTGPCAFTSIYSTRKVATDSGSVLDQEPPK